MTIKWVKVDPLVMNGEPFCYGSRLTVRQLLELRRNGFGLYRADQGPPGAEAPGDRGGLHVRRREPRPLRGVLRARRLACRPGLHATRRQRACPSSTEPLAW